MDYMNKILFLTLLIVSFTILSSCGLFESNNISKHYQTFYIGPDTTQYFIHKLEHKSDISTFESDYTFRQFKDSLSQVTMNFTYSTQEPLKAGINIVIADLVLNDLQRLFFELKNSGYIYRYSVNLSVEEFYSIFDAELSNVIIKSDNYSDILYETRKSHRKRKLISDKLLVLFK